jgi:type VI protein secretion system component VasF
MQDHQHGGVLLVDKDRMKSAVVKRDIESLRAQVVDFRDMHHEVLAEQGSGENKNRKKKWAATTK